ncbi:glycosyl hydrolase family 61-domain-containing protein [Echria macrotheca]|uniref:lytic cellulose monooxygenase (C4-dehydrogenating) n=1 Tax=Echria macrotheca TaxID=438768 RepID=A0AAJ0BJ77_9PEZI|nr:glycosyl hydrolase family 61-domain-containing protein [Echria macrotheca]
MAVYLRPMASQSDNINSDGWFKIWDGGYDAATKKFADEKVMAAGDGLFSVDLPSGLPRGEYLARAEIIALHNYLDPQFFVGCAQVFVESDVTGTLSIPEGSRVKIPGYLTGSEKGLKVNIWEKIPTPYVIPGPPVYFPTAAPSSSTKGATSVSSSNGNGNKTEPEGVGIPPTCLLKNANWCGVEVPAYKNENGCWAASDNCYKQADACYKSAPPSGSKNCDVWTAKKCDALRDSCSARRFKGPEKVVLQEVFAHPVPVTKVPDAVAPVGTAVGSVSGGAGGGGGGGKAPKEVDAGSGSGAGYVTGSGSGSGVGSAAGGPSASAAGIAEKVSGSSAAQAQPSVYVGGGVAGAKKASSCSRPARHVEGKRWSA